MSPPDAEVNEKEEYGAVGVDIEEGIVEVGGCGRFQIILQLVLTYLVLCVGSTAFLPYFLMDDPSWLCTGNATEIKGMVFFFSLFPLNADDNAQQWILKSLHSLGT